MVRSPSEGFQKVLEAEDATFAFIHDASQVCLLIFILLKVNKKDKKTSDGYKHIIFLKFLKNYIFITFPLEVF